MLNENLNKPKCYGFITIDTLHPSPKNVVSFQNTDFQMNVPKCIGLPPQEPLSSHMVAEMNKKMSFPVITQDDLRGMWDNLVSS